jgi:allophanate hydrolase subunit 2
VLMKDAQTTGGYLQVFFIAPDQLALLAQRLLGSRVKFQFLTSE